jgi:hypothetical protein
MLSLFSLIVIVSFSMLITKIAAVMLVHTGLSEQIASFQARSAFTGVGFATSEAENVVNHPVRRKIIMSLMLIGNAGVITAMASLMLTFISTEQNGISWPVKMAILLASVAFLWFIASSKAINRFLSRFISRALKKYTRLNVRDYSTLLHLTGGFAITELKVEKGNWLAGKKMKNARLSDEGLNVLGIQHKDGSFLGVLNGETEIRQDDILLIYGKEDVIRLLDDRKNDFFGDIEHVHTANEQQRLNKIEMEKEQRRNKKEAK